MRVNQRQLADVMGKHVNTIQKWQLEGMPVAQLGENGTENVYDTEAVIQWYVNRMLDQANPDHEKNRLDRVRADKIELDMAKDLSLLVPVADMERVIVSYILSCRLNLLGVIDRIIDAVKREQNLDLDRTIVANEVELALKTLSENEPEPEFATADSDAARDSKRDTSDDYEFAASYQ